MPDAPNESGAPENLDLPSGAPDAAAEAARERVAEAAAEEARATQAQLQRDESKAKRSDGNFAHAFLRFLQTRATGARLDDDYLDLLVQLLDRNVPSPFLLAAVSLLDDEAGAAFRAALDVPGDDLRALATQVETKMLRVPDSIADASRIYHWALLLILAVDGMDAEGRARLSAENRGADTSVRDLLQATVLLTAGEPNAQTRADSAVLASSLQGILASRPFPA